MLDLSTLNMPDPMPSAQGAGISQGSPLLPDSDGAGGSDGWEDNTA